MSSNFQKDFNKGRKRMKYGMISIFGVVVLAFISYASLLSKYKYIIQEPAVSYDYNRNTAPQSHFCNEYKEENGCISFTDELGMGQKICGQYKIITTKK